MSYPVVIVIIVITAVISYLIGIFDAKTTNKWFGAEKTSPKEDGSITVADPNIKKLALIQSNPDNELFVEFDDSITSSSYTTDKLNKRKLVELIGALNQLADVTPAKASVAKVIREPKEKLAIQRSLIDAVQLPPHQKKNEITDLIGLVNQVLDEENATNSDRCEIREDHDHELSFWVNDRRFSSVEEVEPTEARERFRKAIDSIDH